MRAILFVNKNIAEIGKDGVIADNPRETNLFFAIIQTEDQRIGKRPLGPFTRATQCPISAREKITNGIHIEPRGVSADGEIIFMGF